jgi:hypothetical protein
VAVADDAFEAETPERLPGLASALAAPSRPETWGYIVWGLTGLVIGVPEVWALVGDPRWPTISATSAHLEVLWSPTKAVVVGLITAAVVQLVTYPRSRPGRRVQRTRLGRLTRQGGEPRLLAFGFWYLPAAMLVSAVAGAITAALTTDRFVLGYVLYGTMALTLLIIPNALAYWWAREVPFPTLYRTLEYLDARYHPALVLVCSLLAILAVHIVAYPWP